MALQLSHRAEGQSAAMPSPFTPIAEYAFLSDCHTGALVAPDGGVDWLCVPRFELPERLRQPARPGGGNLPTGSVRYPCPDGAVYRARHQRADDDVEDARGLGRDARTR